MLRVTVVLDEERIVKDDVYRLDSVWECVDSAFLRRGQKKKEKGVYDDAGAARDYGRMWAAVFALADSEWFTKYVMDWRWYNSSSGEGEQDLIGPFCAKQTSA